MSLVDEHGHPIRHGNSLTATPDWIPDWLRDELLRVVGRNVADAERLYGSGIVLTDERGNPQSTATGDQVGDTIRVRLPERFRAPETSE